MGRSRRRPKSTVPLRFMKICLKAFFQNKTSKKATPNGLADSGCQNATVPAEAKINRAVTIHEKFDHILAAQMPTTGMDTSVACGLHSPHPKDCSGLGDPNTLKLTFTWSNDQMFESSKFLNVRRSNLTRSNIARERWNTRMFRHFQVQAFKR